MSDGPVTEGSIVAYIGADDDDYQEKMRRAQATAEELGRSDPTVHVDANVGSALARLDEVSSKTNELTRAEARLDAAARAAANAASSQYLAELRLGEIQEKGTATAYQLAAAQEAVARASRNAEAAEQRQIAAEIALRTVQQAPTDEPQQTPAAASSGASASVGYIGAWAIGIAATLPLMSALIGAIAAGTGAVLGMGAAGVFAFAGIKQEIESGSAAGQEYLRWLTLGKQDLEDLASVAANSVAPGLESAFGSMHAQMPELTQEISGFGDGLSRVAAFTVDGLVTGFRILNPLFSLAQGYIVGMAQDWDQWVRSGGLLKWGDDVQAVFPLVVDTFGTLGRVILNVLGDLAPLGVALLDVLDAAAHIADFLTVVLGPAFGPVTIGVIATVAAFKNFAVIAPILDAVTGGMFALSAAQTAAAASGEAVAGAEVAVAAASGPAGWVMLAAAAAVGLLAAGLTAGAQAAASASTAIQDYTGAVQQDKGAIGDATQAQLAKNLASADATNRANELGVSERQLTDAITVGGTVRDQLISQLQDIVVEHTRTAGAGKFATQVQDDQAKSAKTLIDTIKAQNTGIEESIANYRRQASVMGELAVQANQQIRSQQGLQQSFGLTEDQLRAAASEQQNLALQTSWVSTQLNIENAAAKSLSDVLQLMNNGSLSVAQAQTAAATATLNLTDMLAKNGTTLDENTHEGLANEQAIQSKIGADQAAAEAIARQTGSQQAGTDALKASKQALQDQLSKLGELTPEIQAYIDKLYAIPPNVSTSVYLNTHDAYAALSDLRAAYGNIAVGPGGAGGSTAYSTGGTVYRAAGGPAYLAGGGGLFEPRGTDTVPAMLTPGEMVIRRKSADYDPQFIRTYNDDPERALAEARAGAAATIQQHFHVTGVQQTDPNVLGTIVGTRARRALTGLPGVNW